MFGDRDFSDLTERILNDLDFMTVLEMNNLSEEDVLTLLIEQGYILYPEVYFDVPEDDEED